MAEPEGAVGEPGQALEVGSTTGQEPAGSATQEHENHVISSQSPAATFGDPLASTDAVAESYPEDEPVGESMPAEEPLPSANGSAAPLDDPAVRGTYLQRLMIEPSFRGRVVRLVARKLR